MTGATDDDARFMAAAIRFSRRHLGLTGTNPSVGCLIVRDGVIVGRGVTARSGRPHAETIALAEAGTAARGATAYVSLEPCSHHGRTPPCADALIAAGISRVVIALEDPDPRVSGNGIARLRDAGLEVVCGLCADLARLELEAYLTRQIRKRPQVILKLAVSRDGMIGRTGEGQVAITGPVARAQAHVLRAESDAILVGIGTALADDPELTCRLPGLDDRSPVRVVLDQTLRLPLSSKLVTSIARGHRLILACAPNADSARRQALEAAGAEILEVNGIADCLDALAAREISSVIVEGGAMIAGEFLRQDAVDRIVLFTSERIIGADGIRSPVGLDHIPDGFEQRYRRTVGQDRLADYIRMAAPEGN